MTARLPWQPPERRREDKAAGRREWAASRAWRQRVCSGAPTPAPPRPGPLAAAATAAANSSPVRDHSGGHGRNGHSCENKTGGGGGGRKASAPNCARCAGRTLRPPPRRLLRPPWHDAGTMAKAAGPELLLIIASGLMRWGRRPGLEKRRNEGASPGPGLREPPEQVCCFKCGVSPWVSQGRQYLHPTSPQPEALHTFPPPTDSALPAAGAI